MRRAEQLLGMSGLDSSRPDPDLDRFVAQGVALYKATGSAKMPVLLFPRRTLTGLVPSPERLAAILREQFGAVPSIERR